MIKKWLKNEKSISIEFWTFKKNFTAIMENLNSIQTWNLKKKFQWKYRIQIFIKFDIQKIIYDKNGKLKFIWNLKFKIEFVN